MNASVGMALGWLAVGSLIATAVLTEHFRTGSRFPRWWLIPVLIIGWPWPVWVWYVIDTETYRTARIGLVTFVVIGALGLGWGGGLKLYDFLYPIELEPPDTPALNAMIEGIVNADLNGNSSRKNEQSHIGIPPPLFTFR